MSSIYAPLRSLSGQPLPRGNLVRLIYIDETGTADRDKKRIVCSVIVHGDNQYRALLEQMDEITRQNVPTKYLVAYREKYGHFIFHAKEVVNGGKIIRRDDPEWTKSERLDFLKQMVSLPRSNSVPIAFSIVNKGGEIGLPVDFFTENDMKIDRNLYEHMVALVNCVDRSDHFLRYHLKGAEQGTLICEDVPYRRSKLKRAAVALKGQPILYQSQRRNRWQNDPNRPPDAYVLRIENIIDAPNFVEKGDAPLLQLADACAWVLQRWARKQPQGEDCMLAMAGTIQTDWINDDPVWDTGVNGCLLNVQDYWEDEDLKKQYYREMAGFNSIGSVGDTPHTH